MPHDMDASNQNVLMPTDLGSLSVDDQQDAEDKVRSNAFRPFGRSRSRPGSPKAGRLSSSTGRSTPDFLQADPVVYLTNDPEMSVHIPGRIELEEETLVLRSKSITEGATPFVRENQAQDQDQDLNRATRFAGGPRSLQADHASRSY